MALIPVRPVWADALVDVGRGAEAELLLREARGLLESSVGRDFYATQECTALLAFLDPGTERQAG